MNPTDNSSEATINTLRERLKSTEENLEKTKAERDRYKTLYQKEEAIAEHMTEIVLKLHGQALEGLK